MSRQSAKVAKMTRTSQVLSHSSYYRSHSTNPVRNDKQACTQTSTGQALTCRQTDFTCQLASQPSARARTRRSDTVLARRNLCPAEGHQACRVEGTDSFECIDTSSSLESCGGCLTELTGVDCTAIEGAEQVGCVQGNLFSYLSLVEFACPDSSFLVNVLRYL